MIAPGRSPRSSVTLTEVFGALRQVRLAENAPPDQQQEDYLEVAGRLRRTLSIVISDKRVWQSLSQQIGSPNADVTPDVLARARLLVTDALTESMHRAGYQPPPQETEIVAFVRARIIQYSRRGFNAPELVSAARFALSDLDNDLDEAIQAAIQSASGPVPGDADQGEPWSAHPAASQSVKRGDARFEERRTREGLVRTVRRAKGQLLLFGAAAGLAAGAVTVANSPGDVAEAMATNVSATALTAGIALGAQQRSETRRRRSRQAATGPADLPALTPDEDPEPVTPPDFRLARRREKALTEQEEHRARALKAEADEKEQRVRIARAKADAAENRSNQGIATP